ncbi:uncharacterized protein TRAVEDRAFT_51309 [Trametes versicolor FP-101664 SS1]|uniref:uncharacterized protein n=1 Tax=Trametes versicolor (strain FP-101664) TaxID=717944 RepID=UPI0004623F31|nr:uncharacterized protein TRAVEDRAFT_51309 [Trametes versicolor FP-101664 SS1]EIW55180.1 hypothetical protein TRAVEDRAFT_51309 [Trametes versicolor FP-101664 SS1]
MRLDLDTLEIVCTFVEDPQTLVSCSLTCHAFREIATKRLLAVRAVDLCDERSIRAFHTFLFASTAARSPYVRIINLLVENVDARSRMAVAQLVVDILKHAPFLERLSIPFGEQTFMCLRHLDIHKAIGKLTRLQDLSIPLWSGYTEQILLTIRSPLKIIRVSLEAIWTSDRTEWITPDRLHEVVGAFSQTLESLSITQRPIKLDPDSKGLPYPAVDSVEFSGTAGPPWVDVLVHMFPSLGLTLNLGEGDYMLVDEDAEQQRIRLANKEHQARGARWERLGTVVGDTLTLYMLGLTCPIGRLMVDSSSAHLKDRLVEVLRDSPPTHLKLTIMLSHGVGAFEDTFPVEVVPRLTHLVLFVIYDNLDEDERTDRFTVSAMQWAAFLELVICAIRHLRLTHLRLVIYYNVDLTGENTVGYSKGFVRSLREHKSSSIAAALMEAVPTLRYVFLTFGGHYEVRASQKDNWVDEDRAAIEMRGQWMKSSGWASVGGEGAEDGSRALAGAQPLRVLEDEVAEKMIEDEGLLVSRQDESMMEMPYEWIPEETADWEPSHPNVNQHRTYPFSQSPSPPIMTGSIIVYNATSEPCHVFVSKYSRQSAHDDWYVLQPGQRDSWERDGWEFVGFKNADDTDRSGVYVRVNTTVTFNGLHNLST